MNKLRLAPLLAALTLLASLVACSSEDPSAPPAQPPDSGATDAAAEGPQTDSSQEAASDAGQSDALADQGPGTDAPNGTDGDAEDAQPGDGAQLDAGCQILSGLGQATCECNGLDDTEWTSSAPFLFESHLDFGTTGWDPLQLTPGGAEILADGNLGGSSVESEIAAFEILARCDFATLLKSEGEIIYQNTGGKKTDILVSIDGRKVGVSVTRAYHYPPPEPYTAPEAAAILTKKLSDIPLSAANAAPQDAWERSILSVLAWDQQHADLIKQEWAKLDASLRGDVILFVTVTDGDDAAIY